TYDFTGRPNVAHLWLTSSPIFPSVEHGNRAWYLLYALLLPLSVLFLIRTLGGDPAVSLFSFLLLYNFNVHWGFAGFTLAVPLVLLFLGVLRSEMGRGEVGKRLLLCLLMAAIFFTHVLAALFASLLAGLYALDILRRERRLRWWWTPLPTWGLLLAWWWGRDGVESSSGGEGLFAYLLAYYPSGFLDREGLWDRLKSIFQEHLHLWPQGWRFPLTISLTLVILLPASIRLWRWLISRQGSVPRETPSCSSLSGRFAWIFLLASVACVALLPHRLSGEWSIYQRFPVFVLLAAITFGSLRRGPWRRWAPTGLVVVLGLHVFLYADYFRAFARDHRGLDPELFAEVPREARLGAVLYDTSFRDQPVYIHFGEYFTVWRGGLTASPMARFRFATVRRRPDALPLPPPMLWIDKNAAYDDRYRELEYLLVRGPIPLGDRPLFTDHELVAESHTWSVYRRSPSPEVR
ncbi:MAG: hypothetical protein MI919_34530, partial [Holophagales bacterium]|nr:hypothetical protein [Holophagales bacterium]